MNSPRSFPVIFFLLTFHLPLLAGNPAGFFLPDSVPEMTLRYKTMKDLIILPVTINDSIQVNLILDTGCRNLILFGKKFKKLFSIDSSRPVLFSGLGDGKPVSGELSLENKVSINHVLGEQIPVVIVSTNNLFGNYYNVHGVIGYDIFLKFEVEINARERIITFRPASRSFAPYGYTHVPLRVVDARPVMGSRIILDNKTAVDLELMIDTGSSLALLLKTREIEKFGDYRREIVLGIGLNGPVSGYEMVSKKIVLNGLDMEGISAGIVSSKWHSNASIGMQVLKDYVVILNYCKSYICFKRHEA
jgi:hypothetical protein